MSHDRGNGWWGPAPHKDTPAYRPWVILSTDEHPFAESECIAAAMTTRRHADGIAVPDDGWIEGGSETQSYVSPWYVATFKYRSFDRRQGRLSEPLVGRVAEELRSYVPALSP